MQILVSAPPNMAPSEIMRSRIKGRSARKLFEDRIKKTILGYFWATVGKLTDDMIKTYLV